MQPKMASDQPSEGVWACLSKIIFAFTDTQWSKIAIHFYLAEYPEIKIEIHFWFRIVSEDQKWDSFSASHSVRGSKTRFIFGFMEWSRIGIWICFLLHRMTGNRNRDSLSASWKDRESESIFVFRFMGYWRREIRICEDYDWWPMQLNMKSGHDSHKYRGGRKNLWRITAECAW